MTTRLLAELDLGPVPEFLVVEDGLACPNPACLAVNELVEVDYCVRENKVQVEVREDGIVVFPDDSDREMETAHWKCGQCGQVADVPPEVEVRYG